MESAWRFILTCCPTNRKKFGKVGGGLGGRATRERAENLFQKVFALFPEQPLSFGLCRRMGMGPRRAVLAALMALLLLPGLLPAAEGGRPARALWVVRFSLLSRASIDQVVETAAANGFEHLLVQVCGRGDAYFPSRVYPPAENCRELLDSGFDPLAYTLERAHARGLKVHAWVNAFLAWSGPTRPKDPGHVLNRHPEWMVVDRRGVSLADYPYPEFRKKWITGIFLSPAHPGACQLVEEFVVDLVERYPLDGVHLDYLRYPGGEFDFGPRIREGFQAAGGSDPRQLVRTGAGEDNGEGLRRWQAYRAGLVTACVARLAERLEAAKPELLRSVAVKPEIPSAYAVWGQDWTDWVAKGYLDMVVPMSYSTRAEVVRAQAEAACRAVGPERVWVGLRAWEVPLEGVLERVRALSSLAPGGYSFFSYDGMRGKSAYFRGISRALP